MNKQFIIDASIKLMFGEVWLLCGLFVSVGSFFGKTVQMIYLVCVYHYPLFLSVFLM